MRASNRSRHTQNAGRLSPFSALPPIRPNEEQSAFGANVHTLAGPLERGDGGSKSEITKRNFNAVPPIKPKVPITGPGKSIKSSIKPASTSLRATHSTSNINSPSPATTSRHLAFLQKPNLQSASASNATASNGTTPNSANLDKHQKQLSTTQSSTVTASKSAASISPLNADNEKGSQMLPEKIKICVKLPNNAREILTVDSNATWKKVADLLLERKRRIKEPEFITSDVPSKRVSGKSLATTTVAALGVVNNSVVHCDEL